MKVLRQLLISIGIAIVIYALLPNSILERLGISMMGWYMLLYGLVGLFIYDKSEKAYIAMAKIEMIGGSWIGSILIWVNQVDMSIKSRSLVVIFLLFGLGILYGLIARKIFGKYRKSE